MAQTIPERHLRCILESRDMVALKTADGDYQVHNGRITAPTTPGLGITPRLDVLGCSNRTAGAPRGELVSPLDQIQHWRVELGALLVTEYVNIAAHESVAFIDKGLHQTL
ncbi:hypothetical protein HRR83_006873 [Exophiala dermatitidis]|uniref:Enolase C-terminal domain-containing protein n=1 Tax=Exophiala dermatitidis TaxID=5970 RepID=A0AAN6ER95_EXODE|nr:hypothetical protein HRR73_005912 [Exophiala dermatitidis]KAJ4570204.1 hypothetical protein HRR82_007415 [Exophiala dermatitidis]KAJ4579846.1 hypothetical protein HRR81_002009 [Exophiala dermatitidis]KAJ4592315.1 hypothetical protein HRR83_006873 [Exophiala dermatitidis]KAJ4611229.1 hypothetical protein HRR85_005059 [Exophiala dermatitidis]